MKPHRLSVYILGAIIIVALIKVFSKSAATAAVAQMTPGDTINVSIPAFNLPPRGDIIIPTLPGVPPIDITFPPVVIPGIPPSNFFSTNYDMRSACACGGGAIPYYITQPAAPPPTLTAPSPPPDNSTWTGFGYGNWISDGSAYYSGTFQNWG